MKKLNESQKALLGLLRERDGKEVTQAEILGVTHWKATAWRVYVTNRLYADWVTPVGPKKSGRFQVHLRGATDGAFAARSSQSKVHHGPAAALASPLARALATRAADNMRLALEVYNRPTLANRVDAFAMLAVSAWEQLLKAELLEARGEDEIFIAKEVPRKTIAIKDCLDRLIPSHTDPVRRNLDRIIDLRNAATHLVCPELQAPLSPIYQACVLNFGKRHHALVGEHFLPSTSAGLLCLVGDESPLDAAVLSHTYGTRVSEEILKYVNKLKADLDESEEEAFAVRLRVRFAKSGESADFSVLHVQGAGAGSASGVRVVEKFIDRTEEWFRPTQAVAQIASKVGHFTSYDFQALVHMKKWKSGNSEYHVLQLNPNTDKYSPAAIDELVRAVTNDPKLCERARVALKAARVKKAKK